MTAVARGYALMAIAMLLLPAGDTFAKLLTQETVYSAGFLAWSRFVVGSVIAVPVAWRLGALSRLGPDFFVRQAIRGGLVAGAITCVIKAVETAPLGDVYGAFFIGPTTAIGLAVILLGERVGWRDWVAVALGFVGVALVVKPTGALSEGLLWALASGCCFGGFLVATRWSAGSAPPMAQLAGQLAFGLLFLAPLGVGDVVTIGLVAPGLLLAQGLISATANLFQLLAVRHAGAARLAPVVYLQILAATTFGWLVFGDRPDAIAALGLATIISAGLFRIRAG